MLVIYILVVTSYESNCFSSFKLVDIKEKIIVLLNLLFNIYKILRNKFEVSEASSVRHANIWNLSEFFLNVLLS